MTKKVQPLPSKFMTVHLTNEDKAAYEALWVTSAVALLSPIARALDNKKGTLLKTILSSETSNKQLTDARAEMRAIDSLLALIVGGRE